MLLASLAAVSGASSQPLGTGYSERLVRLDDTDMPALIYRPDCRNPSLLLVFHGLNRNAESTQRSAQPLAEDFCLLLIVPLFDRETYPSWAYQRGGIVYRRRLQDPSRWTVQLAPQLVRWAQRQEGRAMPVYLLGHSAGAQFLSRVAAFAPTEARRIIIANPSTPTEVVCAESH